MPDIIKGVWTEKSARAYPESAFDKRAARVTDQIDGLKIVVDYDAAGPAVVAALWAGWCGT